MNKFLIALVFATALVSVQCGFLQNFINELKNFDQEEVPQVQNLQQGAVSASPGDIICQFTGTPFTCWIVNESLLPSVKIASLASLDSSQIKPDAAWYGYANVQGLTLTPLLLQVNANRGQVSNWVDSSAPFVAVEDTTTKTNDDVVTGNGYYWPKLRADGAQGSFRLDTNIGSQTSTSTRTQTQVTTTTKTQLTAGGVSNWVDLQELWVLNPFTTSPYGTKIVLTASSATTKF